MMMLHPLWISPAAASTAAVSAGDDEEGDDDQRSHQEDGEDHQQEHIAVFMLLSLKGNFLKNRKTLTDTYVVWIL